MFENFLSAAPWAAVIIAVLSLLRLLVPLILASKAIRSGRAIEIVMGRGSINVKVPEKPSPNNGTAESVDPKPPVEQGPPSPSPSAPQAPSADAPAPKAPVSRRKPLQKTKKQSKKNPKKRR